MGAGARKLKQVLGGQSGMPCIHRIKDKKGIVQADPEAICEVFVGFDQDLYHDNNYEHVAETVTESEEPVTPGEVTASLKKKKTWRLVLTMG